MKILFGRKEWPSMQTFFVVSTMIQKHGNIYIAQQLIMFDFILIWIRFKESLFEKKFKIRPLTLGHLVFQLLVIEGLQTFGMCLLLFRVLPSTDFFRGLIVTFAVC